MVVGTIPRAHVAHHDRLRRGHRRVRDSRVDDEHGRPVRGVLCLRGGGVRRELGHHGVDRYDPIAEPGEESGLFFYPILLLFSRIPTYLHMYSTLF